MDAGSSSNNATDIFVYMGEGSEVPNDVVSVRVHPSVRVIPNGAFQDHKQLKAVDISEGVIEIGEKAFACTMNLDEIRIASTVKRIGRLAFNNTKARSIILPDSIESIGDGAFCGSFLLSRFRIPPLITTLEGGVLYGCRYIFSLELSEDMSELGDESLAACRSLRNLALPPIGVVGENVFNECTDLLQVSADGSEEELIDVLSHRFDNLPIHKMLYYQSYNNLTSEQLTDATNMRSGHTRTLRSKLDPSGNGQDTLGMTPLHILACSTVQNVDMYRIIIDKYPDNLITKDKWGALPLLYAIWGQAPDEIIWFSLASGMHNLYPDHVINWEDMFETLARGDAPWETLAELSRVSKFYNFVNGGGWIDWNKLMYELADSTSFDGSRITPNSIHYLVSEALKHRLQNIGLWYSIFCDEALTFEKAEACVNKRAYIDEILSELEQYESKYRDMKDATTQLELALWYKKIEESRQVRKRPRKAKKTNDTSSFRSQCRVNCGASIVIPHVLPFLIPEEYLSSVDLYSSLEEEEEEEEW